MGDDAAYITTHPVHTTPMFALTGGWFSCDMCNARCDMASSKSSGQSCKCVLFVIVLFGHSMSHDVE